MVVLRGGQPDQDESFTAELLAKPFDIAIDDEGIAWVTSNNGGEPGLPGGVYAFDLDGELLYQLSGDEAARVGIRRPMGIASDSRGNIWVANSGILDIPCGQTADDAPFDSLFQSVLNTFDPTFRGDSASVTLIPKGGAVPGSYKGAGLLLPWGVAIDGNDTVWVANFDGRRLSHLCGADAAKCPFGKQTGDPISPDTGYTSDGLVRNTGVSIDPSGNVWLTNNWKSYPLPMNPGGYQLVVFLGLAKPIQTPLIGPPEPAGP